MRALFVAIAARSAAPQRGGPPGQRPARATPRVPVTHRSRACLHLPAAVSASATSAEDLVATQQLLDAFWLAQGVAEEGQRRRLLAAALAGLPSSALLSAEALSLREGELAALPGVSSTWFLDSLGGSSDSGSSGGSAHESELATGVMAAAVPPPEVLEVSRRLVALRALLGGRPDIDIVFMVTREPGLLAADFRGMLRRLLEMKAAAAGQGADVAKLVEAQPALLLAEGMESSDSESAAEQLAAWRHGLVSDGEAEWARRHAQLLEYARLAGDAHVGFRDGDDPELARWAAKQRAAAAAGTLPAGRAERLAAAGFEADAEAAEWGSYYTQLRRFAAEHGHCTPAPLTGGADFRLTNWCAVQRIARRSGVLRQERVAKLDELGFDWTGSDPLS